VGVDTRAIGGQETELVGLRSRARIPRFQLLEPLTVAEAMAAKRHDPTAVFMAGGIDVVNRMKAGIPVGTVIHLGRIAGLHSIQRVDGGIAIGAAVTHDAIATSALVKESCGGLAALWGRIANPRIRFKGTVGGNLMAAEPGYEAASLLAAAGAELRFAGVSTGQRRVLDVDQLPSVSDLGDTLLESVLVPAEPARRFVYDRSLKGVAGVVVSGVVLDGQVSGLRAAISWAYQRPVCAPISFSRPVAAGDLADSAGEIAAAWCGDLPAPVSDHLASAGYRQRIIAIKLRRGLQALANI
jgi:aerobic carbon-monoxide dehydrogenase medium subunit